MVKNKSCISTINLLLSHSIGSTPSRCFDEAPPDGGAFLCPHRSPVCPCEGFGWCFSICSTPPSQYLSPSCLMPSLLVSSKHLRVLVFLHPQGERVSAFVGNTTRPSSITTSCSRSIFITKPLML